MKKRLVVVAGLPAGVLLAVWLYAVVVHKTPNVDVITAPDAAMLTIDGQPTSKTKLFYLKPGKHTITASMDGFTSDSQTVQVGNSGVTKVSLLLNPNSTAGYDYLQANPAEELQREAMGGQKFLQQNNAITSRVPLISSLPFIDQEFRVDYGVSLQHPNDPTAVAIYITYYSEAAKQQALSWIRFKGYDPSKLEIVYVNKIPGASAQ